MAYKRPRAHSPSASQKRNRGGGARVEKVSLGTELPGEDERDDGAFVPEWKQTVTDERGRRRLHGAFTGGFSAGYFNTVGSKEGWAPKTFVSSRSNRNKDRTNAVTQRLEDFMDEEDLAEAAESRQLETADSFAGIGRAGGTVHDAFFGLFATQDETSGAKVAHKLGWRQNQGVGRKIRRLAHLDESVNDTSNAHLFAPTDSQAISSDRKETHRKGLAYHSEARLGKFEDGKEEPRPMLALAFLESDRRDLLPKKTAPKKSSFGVGVLNDTGSDDEDPYELGPKITFNRTLGKDKKVKKPSKFAKVTGSDRPVFVSQKGAGKPPAASPRVSHDKRPSLRGFVLAIQLDNLTTKVKYRPPQIPSEWKSSKLSSANAEPRNFHSVADAAKSSTLDSQARAKLLGETPIPGRSVFDFISPETRDRLAALTGKKDLPQGRGMLGPEGYQPSEKGQQQNLWTFVPVLDKDIAASALSGYMPYAEDPKKRSRYIGFLELRAGTRSELPERAEGMSVSDWAQELGEFAQAAQVFKPATGKMASRFVSSTASTKVGAGNTESGETLLRQGAAKPEDPAEVSAKAGMYGPMTRSSFPFYPSRLLCKRFNVKPPADVPPDSDVGFDYNSKPKTEDAVSKHAMEEMRHDFLTRGSALQRPAWVAPDSRQPDISMVANPTTAHVIVNAESNDALSKERESEDVFKAIFGEDDD